MFDQLQLLLPPGVLALQTWILAIILAGGIILYFGGARLSRALFAIGFVVAGTLLGRQYHGQFDPRVAAAVAAAIGALLGLLLHRILASLLLGLIAAAISFLVLWVRHTPASWDWSLSWHDLWNNLPPEIAKPFPVIAGTCFVAGFVGSLLFFRIGLALLYSLLSSGIILFSALLLGQRYTPGAMPKHWGPQLALVIALVVISFGIQYRRRPRKQPPQQLPPAED